MARVEPPDAPARRLPVDPVPTREPTTEAIVDQLIAAFNAAASVVAQGPPEQRFQDLLGPLGEPTGELVETAEYNSYLDAFGEMQDLGELLRRQGIDPFTGQPEAPGKISPEAAAREKRLTAEEKTRIKEAEAAEKVRVSEREETLEIAETDRNIDAIVEQMATAIERGDIERAEADRRTTAAFRAATVQSDVLKDFGGRNLPEGAQFFPNLEPGSAFGRAATALTGEAFPGFATGGTFGVSPSAIASPITQAASASALPGIDAASINAMKELARLGVPTIPPTAQANASRALSFA